MEVRTNRLSNARPKWLVPSEPLGRREPARNCAGLSWIGTAGSNVARRPKGRHCKQRSDGRRLLRRDAHLGRSGAHVGIDVLLVLDEVLLEHAHQLARGVVEGGFVLPGLHRIKEMRLTPGTEVGTAKPK